MYLNYYPFHSLRYGTFPVEGFVALTDINTVTGIYEFYKACNDAGIKAIVGMEMRQDNKLLYITLAKSRKGLGEINRLRTHHNLEGKPLPSFAPDFKDVDVISR